ncbi:hypothetical protein [Algicella marina]|uniref:Uncharacterized protein n=1 Tax=Algicella marina TaxID=2683284 RepID=A0A6P1T0K0_9RHOB|nr:hypothetical protein [Algicella marina]QHQ35261.1 hypothetical protein GO499_08640 [Algicella marina]
MPQPNIVEWPVVSTSAFRAAVELVENSPKVLASSPTQNSESAVLQSRFLHEIFTASKLSAAGSILLVKDARSRSIYYEPARIALLGDGNLNAGLAMSSLRVLPNSVGGTTDCVQTAIRFSDRRLAALWTLARRVNLTELPRVLNLIVGNEMVRLNAARGRASNENNEIDILGAAALVMEGVETGVDFRIVSKPAEDIPTSDNAFDALALLDSGQSIEITPATGSVQAMSFDSDLWPSTLQSGIGFEQVENAMFLAAAVRDAVADDVLAGAVQIQVLSAERKRVLEANRDENGVCQIQVLDPVAV